VLLDSEKTEIEHNVVLSDGDIIFSTLDENSAKSFKQNTFMSKTGKYTMNAYDKVHFREIINTVPLPLDNESYIRNK
jgi:hypothetical protein